MCLMVNSVSQHAAENCNYEHPTQLAYITEVLFKNYIMTLCGFYYIICTCTFTHYVETMNLSTNYLGLVMNDYIAQEEKLSEIKAMS